MNNETEKQLAEIEKEIENQQNRTIRENQVCLKCKKARISRTGYLDWSYFEFFSCDLCNYGWMDDNLFLAELIAKRQGFLLGTIGQLKEEIEFIKHIHSCENGCKSCREELKIKYAELTADLKEAEDKLKEIEK